MTVAQIPPLEPKGGARCSISHSMFDPRQARNWSEPTTANPAEGYRRIYFIAHS
jgi:hypothetical protein